jgi:hypothetical protein
MLDVFVARLAVEWTKETSDNSDKCAFEPVIQAGTMEVIGRSGIMSESGRQREKTKIMCNNRFRCLLWKVWLR